MKRIKRSLQKGFTLIELMIVVAIIGIIVALAVPAYQDYTLKARISEASSLSAAVRTAIDVAYSEGILLANMPVTASSLGVSAPTSYNSKYVASVGAEPNGVILVTLHASETTLGTNTGLLIRYAPVRRGGNLQWQISYGGSTVPDRYIPKP